MYRKWTNQELKTLQENSHLPNRELCIILNRSLESIKTKLKKEKINRERVYTIGSVYNKLKLIDRPFSRFINDIKRTFGVFICECGNLVEKRIDNVVSGKVKSCGNCKGK